MLNSNEIPSTGFKGLKENWHNDLIAAISVALVALPLALGIAVASGVEPMAGILSCIIGGVVTTFYRGSHMAINGPAAGLIAVVLVGLSTLEGNIHYVLAAIVISGGLQVLLGLFKLGRFGKMLPSSVLQGIMAAIGIIIFSKQIHYALGTTSSDGSILETLKEAFYLLPEANPFVVLISLSGMLLLIFYKRINIRFFHLIPAPMWVLLISFPFVFGFDFFNEHIQSLFGNDYSIGPEFLISIPDNPLDVILYPDFAKIGTWPFWTTVISINLISSIQTLAMTRAVDKVDPYRRVTDLNKDLIGVGLSTMVSGALGGLPIITVIVRSTVNVQSNAKTKWSNLYHGLFLLLFVLLFSSVLQSIPLAALATILVYTGFKLASPQAFKNTYDQGVEQLVFMISTLIITLTTDLLTGIIGGILVALFLHMLLAKVGFTQFFKMIFRSGSKIYLREDGSYDIKFKGIANFLAVLEINKLLDEIPKASTVRLDWSKTRLVDLSVMENVIDFKRVMDNDGGKVTITGLDQHVSSSTHNRALKLVVGPFTKKITKRQIKLQKLAVKKGWSFQREVDWNTSYLRNFKFFESRPIERKSNSIRDKGLKHRVEWEIADIVFDEGAMMSLEVFHTSVLIIKLDKTIPRFSIEKEGLFDQIFDRVKALSGFTEHGLKLYPKISKKFLLMGEGDKVVKKFFHKDLVSFLEEKDIHHIESNGEALMIFKYLHIAPTNEVENLLDYASDLLDHMESSNEN